MLQPALAQENFIARNSILSEYGVLGFELGYSYENPRALATQNTKKVNQKSLPLKLMHIQESCQYAHLSQHSGDLGSSVWGLRKHCAGHD